MSTALARSRIVSKKPDLANLKGVDKTSGELVGRPVLKHLTPQKYAPATGKASGDQNQQLNFPVVYESELTR